MKILVIHQYYLMPGSPGGSRFNELARLWTDAGHEVTVIAGNLDYVTGEVPERYRGKWLVRETDGPVTVYRCHVPRTYSKNYVGRAWGFGGFTLSSMTGVVKAVLADRGRPDIVVATSPPLVAALPGILAAQAARAPLIFEIRDLWPESAVTTGVLGEGSPITRVLYLLEKWACRFAAKINVLTPAFRDDLIRRRLAPESKICVIPNGADVSLFKPAARQSPAREEFGWNDRFVVLYAGAHGRANAIGQLVDAASLLKNEPDILIATVGDGPERARWEAEAKSRGLTNIQFCGAHPKSRMPEFVNGCDVGAAVLQNNPTFRTVYPNKVFDYMACEKPTLLAIDGVARKLVCDDAQAGVFAEPENPRALADAIILLRNDEATRRRMGRNGRRWVLENATREALASQYLAVIREVVDGAESRTG